MLSPPWYISRWPVKYMSICFVHMVKANLKVMQVQNLRKGWASSNAFLTCTFFIRNFHLDLLHGREINTPQANASKSWP